MLHEDGESDIFGSAKESFSLSRRLRHGMYIEGKGTWFSLTYIITPPGKYNVDFNYDDKPDFTFSPDARDYADDLKIYPRDPEHIPDWLREELRKAEEE